MECALPFALNRKRHGSWRHDIFDIWLAMMETNIIVLKPANYEQ
jgi:hypothetical protein